MFSKNQQPADKERFDYIVNEDGKISDAYPLIRDAENLCRQAADKKHSCNNCPSKRKEQ